MGLFFSCCIPEIDPGCRDCHACPSCSQCPRSSCEECSYQPSSLRESVWKEGSPSAPPYYLPLPTYYYHVEPSAPPKEYL